jgi:hypothetical protein
MGEFMDLTTKPNNKCDERVLEGLERVMQQCICGKEWETGMGTTIYLWESL